TVRDPRGISRRNENEWPLARTRWTRYYLDAGAVTLSTDKPASAGKAEYEAFGSGVTLRSAPFAADTEFTGPVAAKLFVSSSTADMDLFLTLRVFDPHGGEVTFVGANDPKAPVSQGWLRVSPRETYEVDVEIWPTSIVVPVGYTLALTIAGKDFERPETQGLMKGSGIFLHDDPADRPGALFGGSCAIHTGDDRASYLLMPLVPAR